MGKDAAQFKPSALERFTIGYEFNKSWHDAKRAIKVRTDK